MPKVDIYIEKLSRESYRNLVNYITSLPYSNLQGIRMKNGGHQNEFPRVMESDYHGIELEVFSEAMEGDSNKIAKDLMNIIFPKE